MRVPRHKHAAALLPDGSVVVVGGSDARDWRGQYRSVERWRPSTRSFAPARPMRAARFKLGASVVALPGGRVVVAGGSPVVELFTGGRFVTASLRLDAARGLYEAAGFEVEGVLRGEFLLEGDYVDDVLMALDLTA